MFYIIFIFIHENIILDIHKLSHLHFLLHYIIDIISILI